MRPQKLMSVLGMAILVLVACGPAVSPTAETLPSVSILLPASGGIYAEGANITLQVEAADQGTGVARIVLFVDEVRFAEERAPNEGGQPALSASFYWETAGEGPHELSVVAYRADGTASASDRILVSIVPPSATPLPPTAPPTEVPPTETPILPSPTDEPTPTETAEADDSGAADVGATVSSSDPGVLQAVTTTGTNVRTGPGTDYEVAFTLLPSTTVDVVGRDTIQGWYEIRHYPNPDSPASWIREGWIFWENLDIEGDGASVPVVQAGPPPPGGGPTPVDPNATALPPTVIVPTSPPEPLVALPSPILGTGFELCENPNMLGPQVHYYNWLNGVAGWWQEEYTGIQLPGGITQGVRSQYRDPGNVIMIQQYLLGRFGSTAVEMGGTWRVFSWAMGQSDIPVQAGRQYTVTAHFHPFVQIAEEGTGAEVWASAENAEDWQNLLQWRWVITGSSDNEIADFWRNGLSLGTQTWELHPEGAHAYSFSFTANRGDEVTASLQFQNLWPIAVSKVWMHAASCYEF